MRPCPRVDCGLSPEASRTCTQASPVRTAERRYHQGSVTSRAWRAQGWPAPHVKHDAKVTKSVGPCRTVVESVTASCRNRVGKEQPASDSKNASRHQMTERRPSKAPKGALPSRVRYHQESATINYHQRPTTDPNHASCQEKTHRKRRNFPPKAVKAWVQVRRRPMP